MKLTNCSKLWRRFFAVAAIALSFTAAVESRAAVLLDTFLPGNSAPGPAWGLGNSQMLAVHFNAPAAVTIDSILAAIEGSGDGNLTFGIMSDASGLPSNTFLHSVNVTGVVIGSLSLTGLSWGLGAGDYWLAAVTTSGFWNGWWPGGNTNADWALGHPSILSWELGNTSPFAGPEAPAARITTTNAIPEPETYAMLLAGLGLLGFAARRRRQHAA